MINYSITARAVNPNLFEINQAKTRINQAKAEGKTPDTKDEALVGTVVTNYFATAQYTEVMGIEKFARHIADHGTTYSRADIMAILYMAVDCMREQLLEGKKIRLGELGDFSLSLSSKGAETAEKFSSQNIQRVTVCWEPGTASSVTSSPTPSSTSSPRVRPRRPSSRPSRRARPTWISPRPSTRTETPPVQEAPPTRAARRSLAAVMAAEAIAASWENEILFVLSSICTNFARGKRVAVRRHPFI